MSISMVYGVKLQSNSNKNVSNPIFLASLSSENLICLNKYRELRDKIFQNSPTIRANLDTYNRLKNSKDPLAIDSAKIIRRTLISDINYLITLINNFLLSCYKDHNWIGSAGKQELDDKLKELEEQLAGLNQALTPKPAPQQSWQDQMWHNLQKMKLPPILPRSLPSVPPVEFPPFPSWPFPNMPSF
jgi:hypothetical protein